MNAENTGAPTGPKTPGRAELAAQAQEFAVALRSSLDPDARLWADALSWFANHALNNGQADRGHAYLEEKFQLGEAWLPPEMDQVLDDIDTAQITVPDDVTEQYMAYHPEETAGQPDKARKEIRGMLADLLENHRTGWEDTASGFKGFLEGYAVTVSPDGQQVTKYFTLHRRRTWEQNKPNSADRKDRAAKKLARLIETRLQALAAQVAKAGGLAKQDGQTLVVAGPIRTVRVHMELVHPRKMFDSAFPALEDATGLRFPWKPLHEEPAELPSGWMEEQPATYQAEEVP